MSILTNEQGLTVIELNFVAPIAVDPQGSALRQPYARAYLAWIDQYADSTDVHDPSQLRDVAELRFGVVSVPDPSSNVELLPLVPQVVPPQVGDCTDSAGHASICVDGNGYGVPSEVDWRWIGWDGAYGGSTFDSQEEPGSIHGDANVEFPSVGAPGTVVIPPVRAPRGSYLPHIGDLLGAPVHTATYDLLLRVVKANPQGGVALAPLCILTNLTYLGFT